MKNLDEIAKDIQALSYEITLLQAEQSKDGHAEAYALDEILIMAGQSTFKKHILAKADPHTQKIYLQMLSALVATTQDDALKRAQLLYLARLMLSAQNASLQLEELLLQGQLLEAKDLDEFLNCVTEQYRQSFIVEALILLNLTGGAEAEGQQLLAEYLTLFAVTAEALRQYLALAKALLENDPAAVWRTPNRIDLNIFLPYFAYFGDRDTLGWDYGDTTIVYRLQGLNSVATKRCVLLDMAISDQQEVIDLSNHPGQIIHFKHCTFRRIQGITCQNAHKRVIFEHCHFSDCHLTEGNLLLNMGWCELLDTLIEQCIGSTTLIECRKGKMVDSKIVQCTGKEMESDSAFLKFSNTLIENCLVEKVTVKSNDERRSLTKLTLLRMENADMHNTRFVECECYGSSSYSTYSNNYILAFHKSIQRDVSFKECVAEQSSYGKRLGSKLQCEIENAGDL